MHRTFLSAVLLALVLAVAACSGGATDSASPSAAASASPPASASAEPSTSVDPSGAPEGEATAANDLGPGDCFNTDGSQVDEVTVVDCGQPHFYEAFLNYDMSQGESEPYPGDEAVLDDADNQCRPAFEDFVGTAYDDSALYITVIRPSESTWGDGDRTVICVLNEENADTEMTGSAEDSQQ